MVGIHFNNNGIAIETKFFKEVMKIFQIREEDLVACNRSREGESKGEAPGTGNFIDYQKYLRKYFNIATPTINEDEP